MFLKRHQEFWLETKKKWTEKWFKFITYQYHLHGREVCWGQISMNPNFTIEFIENNPKYPWNWETLSRNPNLTMEFIEAHLEYNWDWERLTKNPNITFEFIKAHLEYNWNWRFLSRKVTIDIIEDNIKCPWNWFEISKNPNITMEFIEAHPMYHWIWPAVTSNPNLKMEFIEEHPRYNWDMRNIFTKIFPEEKELFMIEEALKYMAVYKIKNWWKKIYYSPNTKVGKRRLMKSYNTLLD